MFNRLLLLELKTLFYEGVNYPLNNLRKKFKDYIALQVREFAKSQNSLKGPSTTFERMQH